MRVIQLLSMAMLALLLVISQVAFAESVTYSVLTSELLRSQQQSELQQLNQLKIEYREDQKSHDQRMVNIEKNPISKSELSQLLLEKENAEAAYESVEIAIADVNQSIGLIRMNSDNMRNKLQTLQIEEKSKSSNLLKQRLKEQATLLDIQKTRLQLLQKIKSLRGEIRDYARKRLATMKDYYQRQQEQRKIDAIKDNISELHKEQGKIFKQLLQSKVAGLANHSATMVDNEYANYIMLENITLNRLSLFLLQLQVRAEEIFSSVKFQVLMPHEETSQLKNLLAELTQVSKSADTRLRYLNSHRKLAKESYNSDKVSWLDYEEIDKKLQDLVDKYNVQLNLLHGIQQRLQQVLQADQRVQHETYFRDTLPGWNGFEWKRFGEGFLEIPKISVKYAASVGHQVFGELAAETPLIINMCIALLMLITVGGYILSRYLKRVVRYLEVKSRRFSQKLLWVVLGLFRSNLLPILMILVLFIFQSITEADLSLLIHLLTAVIFSRVVIKITKLLLVTGISDVVDTNIRLFRRLRTFYVISTLMISVIMLVHQLPVAVSARSFANRIFMAFLLLFSLLLFRAWNVLPKILHQIFSVQKNYILNAIRLFCHLLPFTLFSNAVIGLVGYVQLASIIGIYQVRALLILLGYLVVRGITLDLLELCYQVMIKRVRNGWLWVQVLLKPLDTITRVLLVIIAFLSLVYTYDLYENPKFISWMHLIYSWPMTTIGNNKINLQLLIETALIVSILVWIGKWSREFSFRVLYIRARDVGVRNSLSVFTQYAVVILGGLIALRLLGIDLHGLAVVAAAFAAGIGFGLRDMLSNFFSGIMLLVERPFRAGDSIALGQYEGEVVSTGMRSMRIRTWDRMDVIVPNSDIFTKPFVNWTHQDSIVRTVIKIKLDRIDNPVEVQQLIYHVLEKLPSVVNDPKPEVFMKEISETLLEMEIRYYINLQVEKSRPRVRSEVLFSVWNCFKENGIHPPYPHYDLQVTKEN